MRSWWAAIAALASLWSASADAHPPYGLVADRSGNVYFSDLEAVWRITPEGRLELFRASTGTHVHELAVSPRGEIVGDEGRYDPRTEAFSSGVWRRTPDGRETWILAPTPTPPKGFGLVEDEAGNRYTTQRMSPQDRRTMLLRRRPDGRVETLFGSRADAARLRQADATGVGGLALLPGGAVVFADAGAGALRRVPSDGNVTTLLHAPGAALRGVSVAPDGRALVADMERGLVIAAGADGRTETLYRAPREWRPTAAILDGPRLLVLEANADPYDYENRVRVIEVRGGSPHVVAAPGAPRAAAPAPAAQPSGAARAPAAIGGVAAIAAAAALVFWLRRREGS